MRIASKFIVSSFLFCTLITLHANPHTIHPKYSKHHSYIHKLEHGKLNVYGHVDGSYNYLTNRNRFTSGQYNRAYDRTPNGVTLNQVSMTLEYAPEGLGFLFNPVLGHDAPIMAPYGIRPYTQFKSDTLAVDIAQASVQYKHHNLELSAGRMYTLGGRESVNTTTNTNFSRSFLFMTNPNFVLGTRGIYQFNKNARLVFGLNNGWNNLRDYNRRPTIELGGAYVFNDRFKFEGVIYSGEERAASFTSSGPKGTRNFVDLIASYQYTDFLSFGLDYNFTKQSKALLPTSMYSGVVWSGLAAYTDYRLSPELLFSLRGEYFKDSDGYVTGQKQNLQELTFTINYSLLKNIELRAESRRDFSNKASFTNDRNHTEHHQQSYALQGVVTFGGPLKFM